MHDTHWKPHLEETKTSPELSSFCNMFFKLRKSFQAGFLPYEILNNALCGFGAIQRSNLGAPLKCTVSDAEQGIICLSRGFWGRWRWTLATFEVSAFSHRCVCELRGPAAAYQTLPKDKATLCFVFFHAHKDRLLIRLQSLSSDLASGLWSRVSANVAKKKRDFISLLSFLQLKYSSEGFWNLPFCDLRFLRIFLKRYT